MTARTSAPSVARRLPWLTMGLSAGLSSCSQWLDVPNEPGMAEEAPPARTGPVAPPQWRPPLEGSRYYRPRAAPRSGAAPLPGEPAQPDPAPPPERPAGGEPELDAGAEAAPGEPPALDAALPAPDELEVADAASPPAATCAGRELFEICWYLGEPGASCARTCAAHGGPAVAAVAHVGTAPQGGSREDCVLILNALSQRYRVRSVEREEGVGCHLAGDDADPYWASYPPFTASECLPEARIACGCND